MPYSCCRPLSSALSLPMMNSPAGISIITSLTMACDGVFAVCDGAGLSLHAFSSITAFSRAATPMRSPHMSRLLASNVLFIIFHSLKRPAHECSASSSRRIRMRAVHRLDSHINVKHRPRCLGGYRRRVLVCFVLVQPLNFAIPRGQVVLLVLLV